MASLNAWRALTGALVAFTLMVWLGVAAGHDPRPHGLPVGIAAPGPLARSVAEAIEARDGDRFAVTTYADVAAARAAIESRTIYAAYAPQEGRILIASAAGPAAANAASTYFTGLARAKGQSVTVDDVVPLPASDPFGSTMVILALAQVMFGLIAAVNLRIAAPRSSYLVRLGFVAVFAAGAGVIVGFLTDPLLGSFPGALVPVALAVSLVMFAVGSAVLAGDALFGIKGIAIVVVTIFLFGNPTAAPTSVPQMLPPLTAFLNAILPPGQGVALIREAAFFDWQGTAQAILVLSGWALAGAGSVVAVEWLGRRRRAGSVGHGVPGAPAARVA